MNAPFFIDQNIFGSFNPVELCLVIINDRIKNLHSLGMLEECFKMLRTIDCPPGRRAPRRVPQWWERRRHAGSGPGPDSCPRPARSCATLSLLTLTLQFASMISRHICLVFLKWVLEFSKGKTPFRGEVDPVGKDSLLAVSEHDLELVWFGPNFIRCTSYTTDWAGLTSITALYSPDSHYLLLCQCVVSAVWWSPLHYVASTLLYTIRCTHNMSLNNTQRKGGRF